jgi:hypothetical protein
LSASSLLSFLETPVVVGDPDGCAAYVNPAFETCFAVSAETVTGQPLASLFEGGVREAVLLAVADVCSEGRSTRFRMRHAGRGYGGLASPIVAEDARVGFVILLFESAPEDERALALQRQMREPLAEVLRALDELGDADSGRRKTLLEDALRAAGGVRKTNDELGGLLSGARGSTGSGRSRSDGFDPGSAIGNAAARISSRFAEAGVVLEVRVPPLLPAVRGREDLLVEAVSGMLEARLAFSREGSTVVVSARLLDRGDAPAVIIAVLDQHDGASAAEDFGEAEPEAVQRAVQALGGDIRTTADPATGRVTGIRLPALKG